MNPTSRQLPLVSIVTPSLNQGPFIEQTILSVLNQDYPNIEYIVVDGASTDNTINILKKYEGKLKWISEKDKGQAEAITKGFKEANGMILAWLNSDDTYLPDAIGKVVRLFTQNREIKMVYGKTYYVNTQGEVVGKHPAEPFDYDKLAENTFICQPSTFLDREVYKDIGGLNINLHYTMDYDLWVRIARKFKIEYIPEFLSRYRLHDKSKTISELHALSFHREYLKTVMKYYQRAPANRVYGYGYHLVKRQAPPYLVRSKFFLTSFSLIVSLLVYLRFNKRIFFEDIKMINPSNLGKLSKEWIDIVKGNQY